MQLITRKGNFDSGHRVLNEFMKCYAYHGHTYLYELTFSFENMEEIGYAIDFKEIKRVFCQFIDDKFDHCFIANPKDATIIEACNKEKTPLWLMSLNGEGEYCNPSVENIAKEIFMSMDILSKTLYSDSKTGLKIHGVKIYETPNCFTECFEESISNPEKIRFWDAKAVEIAKYAEEKGVLEYDDRKL